MDYKENVENDQKTENRHEQIQKWKRYRDIDEGPDIEGTTNNENNELVTRTEEEVNKKINGEESTRL